MTAPMNLPIVGEIKVREVSKEELMDIWKKVLETAAPEIRFGERMEEITPDGDAFVVRTNRASYRAASVLLAIGRRGRRASSGRQARISRRSSIA